jgi:hypothetical protein
MKDGCFHMPKNVLKNQHREILAGKKKKKQKNDYIKGMNILEEADDKMNNLQLDENIQDIKKLLIDAWKEVRSKFKNIQDVNKWFSQRKIKIKQYIDTEIEDKNAKLLVTKAYNGLEYVTNN